MSYQTPAMAQSLFLLTSKEKQEAKDLLDAQKAIKNLFPSFKEQIEKHVGTDRTKSLPGN